MGRWPDPNGPVPFDEVRNPKLPLGLACCAGWGEPGVRGVVRSPGIGWAGLSPGGAAGRGRCTPRHPKRRITRATGEEWCGFPPIYLS